MASTSRAARRVSLTARSGVETAAVAFAVAALAVALTQLPDVVSTASDFVRGGLPSAHERELAPVYSLGIPPDVVDGAASLIPEHATYAVLVGDNLPLQETQKDGLPDLLRYWLLPRRRVSDLGDAQWVIAYGRSTESIDARLRRQTEVSPAVIVAEVER